MRSADQGGDLCKQSLRKLIEFHIQSGTAGLVLAGTTGESSTLTPAERRKLLEEAVAAADGRIAIIAGTGTADTRQSIELTQDAQRRGVQACMLVVPAYSRPTQEGLYRHFTAIADATELPVMLYNVSHRTACDLQPQTVARLASHERIASLKESFGAERFRQLHSLLDEAIQAGFCLYSGTDELTLEAMQEGAHGVVSVVANVLPAKVAEMVSCKAQGDDTAAARLHQEMSELNTALFAESNPIPVKWALSQMGLIPPGIRLPLTEPTEQTQGELLRVLQGLKVV